MTTQGDLDWHVSRTCDGGACIRVARNGESVLIGNTSSPEGQVSEFTADEWRHFLAGAKSGDFDSIALGASAAARRGLAHRRASPRRVVGDPYTLVIFLPARTTSSRTSGERDATC